MTTEPAFVIFCARNLRSLAVAGRPVGYGQAFEVVAVTTKETLEVVFAFRRAVAAIIGIVGLHGRLTLVVDTDAMRGALCVAAALELIAAEFGAVPRFDRYADPSLETLATAIALAVWSAFGIVAVVEGTIENTGVRDDHNSDNNPSGATLLDSNFHAFMITFVGPLDKCAKHRELLVIFRSL